MAPIITVHRGELLQIERMIDQDKVRLEGDIFGLRTESRQPVIQFVCGQSKDYDTIKQVLEKGHGLLKLGKWIVSRSQNTCWSQDVTLVFNEKGKLMHSYDHGEEATLDILKGQSAFRLYKPLTKNLADPEPISTETYDTENEEKEAQVTKEQWYSKPSGVEVLQKIHQTFPQSGIKDISMSRDTVTEDISLSLTAQNLPLTVYFPAFFPKQNPKVRVDDQEDWLEAQLQYEDTIPPEDVANLLLAFLQNFVINEENKKKQEKMGKKTCKKNKRNRKPQKTGQDAPVTEKEPPPMTGRDAPVTEKEPPPMTGQDAPVTEKEPPPMTGQDAPVTEKEPTPMTGRDAPVTEKEPPPVTGQDAPVTEREPPPMTGQDAPVTEKEPPPMTGQDAPVTEIEPPPMTGQDATVTEKEPLQMGENEKHEDLTTTRQELLPSMTKTNDKQHQGGQTTDEEQSTTLNNKTDEATEQDLEENMDIDMKPEQQTSEEDMEVDEDTKF